MTLKWPLDQSSIDTRWGFDWHPTGETGSILNSWPSVGCQFYGSINADQLINKWCLQRLVNSQQTANWDLDWVLTSISQDVDQVSMDCRWRISIDTQLQMPWVCMSRVNSESNRLPKFFSISNSDLISHHWTILQEILEYIQLPVKKNSIGWREILIRRGH